MGNEQVVGLTHCPGVTGNRQKMEGFIHQLFPEEKKAVWVCHEDTAFSKQKESD